MSQVVLNYVPYEVKVQSKHSEELEGDCRGLCDFENTTLYLSSDIPKELREQTFFHELFHAMCDQSGFNNLLIKKLGDTGYEVFTDNMGRLIYELLYKNDIKKIVSDIRGE